jgi:hypothetical protein
VEPAAPVDDDDAAVQTKHCFLALPTMTVWVCLESEYWVVPANARLMCVILACGIFFVSGLIGGVYRFTQSNI